jgi:hypothetical protein
MSPTDDGCDGNYGYPELLVSKSVQQPKVNDLAWKLADLHPRWVLLQPDTEGFSSGHYYVGIYGWCTPDDICPDADTCGACSKADNLPYNITVSSTAIDETKCKEMMITDDEPTGGASTALFTQQVLFIFVALYASFC